MKPLLSSDMPSAASNSRRTRRLILVAVCAALVIAYFGLEMLLENRLSVVNQSGQTVKFIEITVCGRTTRFENLPQGETASEKFVADRDDSFLVRGELADGRVIQARAGYVTNGIFGEKRTFTILPDGQIQFR